MSLSIQEKQLIMLQLSSHVFSRFCTRHIRNSLPYTNKSPICGLELAFTILIGIDECMTGIPHLIALISSRGFKLLGTFLCSIEVLLIMSRLRAD